MSLFCETATRRKARFFLPYLLQLLSYQMPDGGMLDDIIRRDTEGASHKAEDMMLQRVAIFYLPSSSKDTATNEITINS